MLYHENLDLVLNELKSVLSKINEESIYNLKEDILNANKVFVVGVGRVLLSLQAFVKRLNHLNIPTYYVGQIDEPCFTKDSVLIVGSGSGNTLFPVAIAKKAKSIGAKVIHIGSNKNSDIKDYIDYMIRIPTRTKLYLDDEVDSKQIMTSLFEQSLLLLGDIICKMIIDEQNIDIKDLWESHANLE